MLVIVGSSQLLNVTVFNYRIRTVYKRSLVLFKILFILAVITESTFKKTFAVLPSFFKISPRIRTNV